MKKKSNDLHGMNMNILRQVIPNIVKPFTYICHKYVLEGCFSDKMNISRSVPAFKAGDKSSLNNFTPITVLRQFSKILERLCESRLLFLCVKNNILNDNQYGLRRNTSTTIALLDLSRKVLTFRDKKLSTLGRLN